MELQKQIPELRSMAEITEEKLKDMVTNNKTGKIIFNGEKKWLGKKHLQQFKEKEKEGGVVPLLTLLPLIFGGLSAAGAVAGGVATTVAKAKEAEKYSAETEQIKKGKGIYLNRYQGKGIKDFLKNILEQSNLEDEEQIVMKNVLKNLSEGAKVKVKEGKHGMGIFLSKKYNQNE